MNRIALASLVAFAGLSSFAAAADFGGTLTSNGAYFRTLGYNVQFGDADLKAPGTSTTGIDNLYKNCWYYRPSFSSTSRRFGSLGDPDVSTYLGDTSNVKWNSTGPFGAFFAAQFKVVLTGFNNNQAMLQSTCTITNQQNTSITYNIYYAVDPDIGGSGSSTNDTISLVTPGNKNSYRATDASGDFIEVLAENVTNYALGGPTQTWNQGNLLTLPNTGSGSSGDVAGVQQWTFTLAPGQSKTLRVALGLNMSPSLPCAGDYNRDGFLDFTDFDAFVADFEAGNAGGDFNGDGFLDFTDFDAFVSAFESGC